jgi:hypothetical protein
MEPQHRPGTLRERTETHPPPSSPATDPTNPHNQEPTGDWTANERASDRRNSEPGLTDEERKRRK